MRERILFVDDEPEVLEVYGQLLKNEFAIETAENAREALARMSAGERYAVLVADMHMPEMHGIEFLARVREVSPDTVRLMVTGNADVRSAIDAVNEGRVFRFLEKPCSKEVLARALTAALVQYRVLRAEHDLVERTLQGSLDALTEALRLANPMAFARGERLRQLVRAMAEHAGLENVQRFEVAAMLSQLGCLALDSGTVATLQAGRPLSADQSAQVEAHPRLARALIAKIPRMEPIAWMIAQQFEAENDFEREPEPGGRQPPLQVVQMGARLLQLAVAFDKLMQHGLSPPEAVVRLQEKMGGRDAEMLAALASMEQRARELIKRTVNVPELSLGMVVEQDVRTYNGILLASRGQEVNPRLLSQLHKLLERRAIEATIQVGVPSAPVNVMKFAG